MSDFDTIPNSSPLEIGINVYYVISLPYFLGFVIYFIYQLWHKFLSPPAARLRAIANTPIKAERAAKRVVIVKILAALFASSTWINEIVFVFYATEQSCYNGWKVSGILYILAKFWVYVFLYERGELVSIGQKTKFEKLIQIGTMGVPILAIIAPIVSSGEYIDGICAFSMPYEFTVVVIILDFGLSSGYLLMFTLKLKSLEDNFPKEKRKPTTIQSPRTQVHTIEIQSKPSNTDIDINNSPVQTTTVLQQKNMSITSINKDEEKTVQLHSSSSSSYEKIMVTHTRITALTCTSTFICALMYVLYHATNSRLLQILAGPITGLDLYINITAIAYLTRGKH